MGSAEAGGEDGVDGGEDMRVAAKVVGEREAGAARIEFGAAGAEETDIGVAEAVDGLELVAYGEEVLALQRAKNGELARVGVLELVDHEQLETLRPGRAHISALAQESAAEKLEVVEIKPAALALGGGVALGEPEQERIEQRAGTGAFAVARLRVLPDGRRGQRRLSVTLATQLGVDVEDGGAEAIGAEGGNELHSSRPLTREEVGEGTAEGIEAQAPGVSLVEDGEVGVETYEQRMGAQETRGEAVEGAEEGGLGVTSKLAPPKLEKARTDAPGKLAGRALSEGDGKDARRTDAVFDGGADEALDEHGGLAGAGAGGEQEGAVTTGDSLLLLVGESTLKGAPHARGASTPPRNGGSVLAHLGQRDLELMRRDLRAHDSQRQMEG